MSRAYRIIALGAAILLVGAGCAERSRTKPPEPTVSADIQEMDRIVGETDDEDFSASTTDELDVTVEDDAADIEDTVKDSDAGDFDTDDISDDALERG